MHICTCPHDPHTDCANYHGYEADPIINYVNTFDLPILHQGYSSYQHKYGI